MFMDNGREDKISEVNGSKLSRNLNYS